MEEHPPLKALCRSDELEVYTRSLGQPIAQMDKQAFAKALGQQVAVLYELLGIRPDNYLSDAAKSAFATWFRTHYADLEVSELGLAFQLAFREKIEASLEHYQSFSIPFVSQVMKAYRAYRERAIGKVSALHHAQEAWQAYVSEKVRKVREAEVEGLIHLLHLHWEARYNPAQSEISRSLLWPCRDFLEMLWHARIWRPGSKLIKACQKEAQTEREGEIGAREDLTAREKVTQIRKVRQDAKRTQRLAHHKLLGAFFDSYHEQGRSFEDMVEAVFSRVVPCDNPDPKEIMRASEYRRYREVLPADTGAVEQILARLAAAKKDEK